MQILIVKLGALGDLTFARPALRYLKAALPDAQIDWLVSEELADFLRDDQQIRSLLTVPGQAIFRGGVMAKISAVLKARRKLAARYDLILLFHRDPKFLSLVFGKGPIAMPVRSAAKWILPGVTTVLCEPLKRHESLALKRVTDAGLKTLSPPVSIPAPPEWSLPSTGTNDGKKSKAPTSPVQKIIGIHLGGGKNLANEFELKRWPYMQELITLILQKSTLRIRLVGGPDEAEEARQIIADTALENSARIENLVGEIGLGQLQSTIEECDLFFGSDSGPLHIADALQIPSVGIYGPTSPISWGLLGKQSRTVFLKELPCRPCYQDDGIFLPCPNAHKCMRDISAEEIYLNLIDVMNQTESAQ